jgi:hypothetical protein
MSELAHLLTRYITCPYTIGSKDPIQLGAEGMLCARAHLLQTVNVENLTADCWMASSGHSHNVVHAAVYDLLMDLDAGSHRGSTVVRTPVEVGSRRPDPTSTRE